MYPHPSQYCHSEFCKHITQYILPHSSHSECYKHITQYILPNSSHSEFCKHITHVIHPSQYCHSECCKHITQVIHLPNALIVNVENIIHPHPSQYSHSECCKHISLYNIHPSHICTLHNKSKLSHIVNAGKKWI